MHSSMPRDHETAATHDHPTKQQSLQDTYLNELTDLIDSQQHDLQENENLIRILRSERDEAQLLKKKDRVQFLQKLREQQTRLSEMESHEKNQSEVVEDLEREKNSLSELVGKLREKTEIQGELLKVMKSQVAEKEGRGVRPATDWREQYEVAASELNIKLEEEDFGHLEIIEKELVRLRVSEGRLAKRNRRCLDVIELRNREIADLCREKKSLMTVMMILVFLVAFLFLLVWLVDAEYYYCV